MISRYKRDSNRWRLSRRLSSLASISSWIRVAAVVKPTDMPAGRRPSPAQGHVGVAGAAVAGGDHVLPAFYVFAAGQFHHQCLVHRRDGWEVEGVQQLSLMSRCDDR